MQTRDGHLRIRVIVCTLHHVEDIKNIKIKTSIYLLSRKNKHQKTCEVICVCSSFVADLIPC